MTKYDVILPAGGPTSGAFAESAGTPFKALIDIEGETILSRTLKALRSNPQIGRLVVIGPREVLDHPGAAMADLKVEPGHTGPDNIFRGLAALEEPTDDVLIVTTDLPFFTSDLVDAFLAKCIPHGEICAPLVPKSSYEAAYPNSTSTFVRLANGTYTIGGMYRMRAQTLARLKPQIDLVYKQRKSKIGMAKLLGLTSTVKFVTKTLTLEAAVRRVEKILGCKIHPINPADAPLAYDIDDQEDYDYAISRLANSTS